MPTKKKEKIFKIPKKSLDCGNRTNQSCKLPYGCYKHLVYWQESIIGFSPQPPTPKGREDWERKFTKRFVSFTVIPNTKNEPFNQEHIILFIRQLLDTERKKARFEGYIQGREEGLNLFNKMKRYRMVAAKLKSSVSKKK